MRKITYNMEFTSHTSVDVVFTNLNQDEFGVHFEKTHDYSGEQLFVIHKCNHEDFLDDFKALVEKYFI